MRGRGGDAPALSYGLYVISSKEPVLTDPKTERPLASPAKLAGSAEGAIAAEFAARDAEEARDADDANDTEVDTLPLDGE